MNRLSSTYSILNNSLNIEYLYSEKFGYDPHGNITSIERWDDNDAMDVLGFTYVGNQLHSIDDSGAETFHYDAKHYHDNSNSSNDFAYDANGNMLYDKDRGIAAICYNLLNLPDTIQFMNGNQIIHRYDAAGNRLNTTYYTRKVNITVPLREIFSATDSLSNYYITREAFHNNVVYNIDNADQYGMEFVHNPEGYIRYYGPEEHYHFYYIKDLLGNIRETYVHPEAEYKECIQRMQYYPSGLPWAEAAGASEQPWKYNGKEFVEMHGLDEYDSKARWYYPAICRTTTMDPLAETYYPTSPYAWCGNNPINKIDVNGDSILLMDDWISTYISINNMLPNNVYVDIENNYIQLNRNSNLTTSNNLFYEDLITAAQSSKTIELRKSNYNVYLKDGIMHSDEFMKPYDYSIDMETDFIRDHLHSLGVPQGRTIHGNLGQSLFPNENLLSGKSSTNSNIQITINAKGTYNHQYVGLAHELGHIILYLQGSAFGHGQIGVDAAITLRENQLKDKLGYDY